MNACMPFFFVLFWHRLIGGEFKSSFTTFNHLNPIKVHNRQTAIKTEAVKSTAFTTDDESVEQSCSTEKTS